MVEENGSFVNADNERRENKPKKKEEKYVIFICREEDSITELSSPAKKEAKITE
jgi:hypothetical protein